MAKPRWLTRAPVVHARVEVYAVLPPAPPPDLLDALQHRLFERYPRVTIGPAGCRFTGETPYALEVTSGGMACSRAGAYAGFGPLVGEAIWAWERYVDVAAPVRVSKVAVHYENRFDLPAGAESGRLFPQVLDGGGARFARLCGPGTRAAVVQRSEEEGACFRFDIDVERDVELPADSSFVWRSLGELAKIEHRIFFESVTDEALAPYV
jgi:hypothetical protein